MDPMGMVGWQTRKTPAGHDRGCCRGSSGELRAATWCVKVVTPVALVAYDYLGYPQKCSRCHRKTASFILGG